MLDIYFYSSNKAVRSLFQDDNALATRDLVDMQLSACHPLHQEV